MKFLKEDIARKANKEDNLSGSFFEGRFKSTRLLDIYALTLCSMYVDLNPVRAGKTQFPETFPHTSVYHRIRAQLARAAAQRGEQASLEDHLAAAWLSPIDDAATPPDGLQSEQGRRLSDEGFLPMPLEKYLAILDWSGRQERDDKRGAIPDDLAPVLARLNLDAEEWLQGIQHFDEWFSDFAGRPSTLKAQAVKLGCERLRRST